jgi:hypothetical protein
MSCRCTRRTKRIIEAWAFRAFGRNWVLRQPFGALFSFLARRRSDDDSAACSQTAWPA